jgi:hypothetical protein
MRRAFGVLLFALVLASCGDSGGAAPVGSNVTTGLPPASAVWFGTAFDPASLALTDKGNTFKAGSPIVAIGTLIAPRAPDQMQVQVEAGGSVKAKLPVAPGSVGNTYAVDLTPGNLGAGTYLVMFVDAGHKSLASSSITLTP